MGLNNCAKIGIVDLSKLELHCCSIWMNRCYLQFDWFFENLEVNSLNIDGRQSIHNDRFNPNLFITTEVLILKNAV